jgi:cytochrome d ubiquinol oxidase subunit I
MLTQNTAVIAFTHTESAAFLVSGALVMAISAYLLWANKGADMARTTLRYGAVVTIVAAAAVGLTGDLDSKIMVQQQPMKMAAAEGLYETTTNAGFSVLTIGNLEGTEVVKEFTVPGLLSFLATGSFDGEVQGINDLQAAYEEQYGEGWYVPNVPITYWSFRLMIGLGMAAAALAALALWMTRGDRRPTSKWFVRAAIITPLLPLLANSFGWIFTEMGRQPWIVFGLLQTKDAVSPTVTAGNVLFTMVVFTLLYGVLAVIEIGLLRKTIQQGPPATVEDPYKRSDDNQKLTFAY